MLLYGPPGTGKTLMARQIGKMLNGKEPKVRTHFIYLSAGLGSCGLFSFEYKDSSSSIHLPNLFFQALLGDTGNRVHFVLI